MVVFVVQHLLTLTDGEESIKMIGVYSTQEKAQQAVDRLSRQPGFRDSPKGFSIDPYTVDKDSWAEGFVTTGGKS
jgi:hypothetical protein